MSECILSTHIQKLGHSIQEIRERTLKNILSKLDHGFVYDNDLARSKEILQKLFEWFLFEQCSYEDVVLKLIKRILQAESGLTLLKLYGSTPIISELRQVRSCVEPKYYSLVDDIIEFVIKHCADERTVPPLQCDVPLSYRSGSTNNGVHYTNNVESTATPIEGFIHQNSSLDQGTGVIINITPTSVNTNETEKPSQESRTTSNSILDACLPFYTLCWQPLILPDRHVLESVEDSLRNPPQTSALLHSCEFFIDVMLHDFPAEVFLQRPGIILHFHKLMLSCPSTRVTAAVINCLLKLTKLLEVRINYYSDPCTHNLKQMVHMQAHSNFSSPCSVSASVSEKQNTVPGTRSPYSSISSENEKLEDTAVLKARQMPLPHYCLITIKYVLTYLYSKPESLSENITRKKSQAGINSALLLVDKLIELLDVCVKKEIWDQKYKIGHAVFQLFNEVLINFGGIIENLRLEVMSSDYEKTYRVIHLHILHNCVSLLTQLIPMDKIDVILPRNLKNSLSSSLLDSSFSRLYPGIHEKLLHIVEVFGGRYETDSISKYKDINSICMSMTATIKFLRNYKSIPIIDCVTLMKSSLKSLDFHKNISIIRIFVELCANKLPMNSYSDDIFTIIEGIVLHLLAHSEIEIRKEMYSLCQKKIITAIGPKLNTSKTGAPGSQIFFLMRSEILTEIVLHGLSSEHDDIGGYSEDILIHILKCKILVSDDIWNAAVAALMPTLPLLICYSDKSSALGRTVIGLLDPDKAISLNVPTSEVLKGNAALLFSEDGMAREEAVSRLCWLLASQDNSRDMLPRVNNLQDKALSIVCQIKHLFDLNKIRSSQHFYQPSSLCQVLELLNSDNVEPVIRRSALTQVSVMMEDPLMHTTFIKNRGVQTVVKLMRSSLTESSYTDYPDSIIPAIAIIKNVCLHNPLVRQELCNNIEVYYWILRGLFLFCTEDRMKQEGSILLFLLLFNSFIEGTPSKGDLAIPHLVEQKLCVPFVCNDHSKYSKYAVEGLAKLVLQDKWCMSSLQIHWNSEWFGGFNEILCWDKVNYCDKDINEFNDCLRLSNSDLCIIQSSSLEFCMNKYLQSIQNGTNHQAVIESINKLTAYLNLYKSVKEQFIFENDILSLAWKEVFIRFLNVQPSCGDDAELLTHVLRFLNLLVPLYKYSETSCWISNLLKNQNNCIIEILQSDTSQETETKVLNQEMLNLIINCVSYEQHYLDYHNTDYQNGYDTTCWSQMIEIISENLKFNDAQHFYNLAYLDCLLSCLVHLTATLGWSNSKSGSPPKPILIQLITGLCEMIGAFHCGKGTSAAASLMGLSITRHAILILNHLLVEMQHSNVKSWNTCFIEDESGIQDSLLNLSSLWSSRDVVLRAAVFQLFSGLAVSHRVAIELVQELKNRDGGLWELCLHVLLDNEEASIVRENVANLLANFASHTVTTALDGFVLDSGVAPTNIKQSNSTYGLLKLLNDSSFYSEVEVILTCLYTSSIVYLDSNNFTKDSEVHYSKGDTSSPCSNNDEFMQAYAKTIGMATHTSSIRSSDTVSTIPVVATPGLIKALSSFLYNLLALACHEVSSALQENGLIKMFFRSLRIPELELHNTKDLGLYCDILEMNACICAMLNRAVSKNPTCFGTVLHTRDCLNLLLMLLNPQIYHTSLPQLVYLRNKLWCEIFGLVGTLLDSGNEDNIGTATSVNIKAGEALSIVSSALSDCGHQPFLQTLCEAISSNSSLDLQQSALCSLTSLLKLETRIDDCEGSGVNTKTRSIQNLLDNTKTPRTPSVEDNMNENLENIAPEEGKCHTGSTNSKSKNMLKSSYERNSFEDIYLGKLRYKLKSTKTSAQKQLKLDIKENESLMAGAELCKILLHLLDVVTLKHSLNNSKKKSIIIATLTSILCVSNEAKKYAMQSGLLEMISQQLREIHLKLSLESIESLRRIADKKRLTPTLKEIGSLIGLITNFMLGDAHVKKAASVLGLADIMHKLWIWLSTQNNLLVDALKMLCTYTTDCITACQSLPLTSCIAGSGPRKSPSNMSLLHAIVSLISKEMDQISRTHDLTVLQLCFHLLQNSCCSTDCRIIMSKSNLLQCLSRLHPAITKRQKPWENVELMWLEYLEIFTGHPEGQASVAKIPDVLELIMSLTGSTRSSNRKVAMNVLRNISFYQSNRPRLLTSGDFLNILESKLVYGSLEEKNIVVSILWSLAANNQKAKLILKCAGLDIKLQETIKMLHLSSEYNVSPEDLDKMHYVLNLLKDGDKSK